MQAASNSDVAFGSGISVGNATELGSEDRHDAERPCKRPKLVRFAGFETSGCTKLTWAHLIRLVLLQDAGPLPDMTSSSSDVGKDEACEKSSPSDTSSLDAAPITKANGRADPLEEVIGLMNIFK